MFVLFGSLEAQAGPIGVDKVTPAVERYDRVSFMRGPHVMEFFRRHERTFRVGAAIHVAHAKAHDLVQKTPFDQRAQADTRFDQEMRELVLVKPPKTEAEMRSYGPYVSQFAWDLYRAIDWTHMHHDQTYSILSARKIPWEEKKKWTDKAVKYYLEKLDLPMSPAPIDVVMRRTGSMMKPYFGYFRNYYPKASTFFFVAHWWHPVIYEAQMLGGSDHEQEQAIRQTEANLKEVFDKRPQRMLLTRELMPRYAQMSPESGNIFDNLHMLHGVAYDILTYPKWSPDEKRKELYRVLQAMKYQPGDEKLARKFKIPRAEMDPRSYEHWMVSVEGEMNRIMVEMMEEMIPHMMPKLGYSDREKVMAQLWKKLTPGIQDGELDGSLHDALMQIVPEMKMTPDVNKPGESNPLMMQAMLAGWMEKYGHLSEVPVLAMTAEPKLGPIQKAETAQMAGQRPGKKVAYGGLE